MEQTKKRNMAESPNLFVSALIGGGISLAVMLLLAFLLPIAVLKLDNPNALSAPIAYICVFLGAMAGSFVSAKRRGDNPFLSGLLSGGVMLLPMLLVSLIIPGKSGWMSLFIIVAVIAAASLIGAFAVMKLGTSSKRNMKKAMKRR